MKKIFLMLYFLFSCSSVYKDKTIATMDDIAKPKWADLGKMIQEDGDKLKILGFAEVDIDAKLSSALRMSDHAARVELSKLINAKMSIFLQNLEEGLADGGESVRNYSTEISRTAIAEAKVTSRFWEKVQTINQFSENVFKLRVYSLLEITKSKFRQISRDFANNNKINPKIKNELIESFSNVLQDFSQDEKNEE